MGGFYLAFINGSLYRHADDNFQRFTRQGRQIPNQFYVGDPDNFCRMTYIWRTSCITSHNG